MLVGCVFVLCACGSENDIIASSMNGVANDTLLEGEQLVEDLASDASNNEMDETGEKFDGQEGASSESYEKPELDLSNMATRIADKDSLTINFECPGPEFSQMGGCYDEEFQLSLSTSETGKGSIIYYTLDGSDPVTSSSRMEYTSPLNIVDRSGDPNVLSAIDPTFFDTAHCKYDRDTKSLVSQVTAPSDAAVDKCTVVKAVCVNADGSYSATTAQTYFVGDMTSHIQGIKESCEAAGMPLAVISISIDARDLFDPETGIYVTGNMFEESLVDYFANGGKASDDCGRKLAANYSQRGRAWEREAYIDFYECTEDEMIPAFSQGCGIRIQGNYSRSDLQKGFRVYARNEYGDKRFRYSLFGEEAKDDEGEVIDSYKTFMLRNGGNCAFLGKFNDTYWQSLVADMNCDTQHSRPAVVYINGEYWGLYVMQEDYSSEFFEDTHDVRSSQVVLYKGDAETYEMGYKLDLGEAPEALGKEEYYLFDLYNFFDSHKDLTAEEDFEEFAKLVDVESCRDYFAVQCWINNKWDWPGKNWSMWRTIKEGEYGYKPLEEGKTESSYADGKWRFCFYDVEFGGVSGESDAYTNTIKEDNYKPYGLLDTDTKNPAVLSFAYLMTNEGFRQDFYATLNQLSNQTFVYEKASGRLKQYENTYGPLLDQFFLRYPGTGSRNDAINGGYGSAKCIRDFLGKRKDYIQSMIDYAESVEPISGN